LVPVAPTTKLALRPPIVWTSTGWRVIAGRVSAGCTVSVAALL
jgi:hypothetical protein